MVGNYKCLDFYMLRTPVLAANHMEGYSSTGVNYIWNMIHSTIDSRLVNQSIAVASKNLYSMMEIKNNKVEQSLVTYFNRMTTRTTPFGLFSGISIGEFQDSSKIILNESIHQRLRPDIEWIYGIVRNIENDNRDLMKLKIKFNHMIYIKGNRAINSYVTNLGLTNDETNSEASIKVSNLFWIIKQRTEDYKLVSELVNEIADVYIGVSQERILDYLKELLKHDYILTELRPPGDNYNPLEYVLETLQGCGIESVDLLAIKEMIDNYNRSDIRNVDSLGTIQQEMKAVYNSDNLIQVDFYQGNECNQLSKEITKDIEDFVEFIERITDKGERDTSLEQFKIDFLDNYGTEQEVPILELLDDDMGIGSPSGYFSPNSYKSISKMYDSRHKKIFSDYLNQKIGEGMANGSGIVHLDSRAFESISDEYKSKDVSPSLELNLIVTSKNINSGEYKLHLGPNVGSNLAGKTFGRFGDILPEDKLDIIDDMHIKEKKILSSEYVVAELNEIFQTGRGNNVTLNRSNMDYEICLSTTSSGEKQNIELNDIVVGVAQDYDQLYLKSKSLNKKIYIVFHHMMNYLNGSNISRFLKEVSYSQHAHVVDTLIKMQTIESQFVPRMVYKNIVIVPKTWNLVKDELFHEEYVKFVELLTKQKKELQFPRNIYIVENDNRLFFDLENEYSIRDLYYTLKKSGKVIKITETEYEDYLEETIVEDLLGQKYFAEIVVPLIKKDKYMIEEQDAFRIPCLETVSDISRNKSLMSIDDRNKNLFFGEKGWYYFKLYITKERDQEILGMHMWPLLNNLIDSGIIEKYFYLKYSDPKFHIRLRINCVGDKFYIMFNRLNDLLSRLREEGVCYFFQSENYIREIERYGGVQIIDNVETCFYRDSEYVMSRIQEMKLKDSKYDLISDEKFVITGLLMIMKAFGLDLYQQKLLMDSLVGKYQNKKYYRVRRKEYMACVFDFINQSEELLENERFISYSDYAESMNSLDSENSLTNDKVSILLSLMHMFCNRVNGAREWEELMLSVLAHSINDVISFNKYKNVSENG